MADNAVNIDVDTDFDLDIDDESLVYHLTLPEEEDLDKEFDDDTLEPENGKEILNLILQEFLQHHRIKQPVYGFKSTKI